MIILEVSAHQKYEIILGCKTQNVLVFVLYLIIKLKSNDDNYNFVLFTSQPSVSYSIHFI